MTAAPRLSGVVIACNEQDRLGDCLRSLAFCDELLVVDSHSTDGTRDVAREHGARVIERDWPGFRAQKEFAMGAAGTDWILNLDADERCSASLVAEIEALRSRGFPAHAGWRMPRQTCYLGRWIRHGGWYPDRQTRLVDRRRARWVGREIHEKVALDGSLGDLRGDLLHDAYRDFAEHLATIDRYTTIMALDLRDRGKTARGLDLFTHPLARFVRFYWLRAGFLDGWRGLLIAYLAAHYARLKYAKLLALQRAEPTARPADALPGTFEGPARRPPGADSRP